MGLVEHARRELSLAKLDNVDSDYNGMLANAVVELMEVFAKQGHSGCSAGMTLDIFNRLAQYKTLTPITSSPDEWVEVGWEWAKSDRVWQNKRDGEFFSKDGGKTWYNVNDKKKGR